MPSRSPPLIRRSQAERSNAMRERLLEATIDCLRDEGYARTSVSKIVERAGVSRGAYLHHYPTKEAVIGDAVGHLLRGIQSGLGEVWAGTPAGDGGLEQVLMRFWREVFEASGSQVFLELLVAARRDEALAKALHERTIDAVSWLQDTAEHYFEPRTPESASVRDLFGMTRWIYRGMGLDAALTHEPAPMGPFVQIWVRLVASQIRPRADVTGPAPGIADWPKGP